MKQININKGELRIVKEIDKIKIDLLAGIDGKSFLLQLRDKREENEECVNMHLSQAETIMLRDCIEESLSHMRMNPQ